MAVVLDLLSKSMFLMVKVEIFIVYALELIHLSPQLIFTIIL